MRVGRCWGKYMSRYKLGIIIRIAVVLILVMSARVFAAEEADGSSKAKTKASRKSVTQLRYGLSLWQETITLASGAAESKMVAQSMGVLLGLGRSAPMGRSKWNFTYGAELGLGTIKGKGNNDNVPDELKNQLWYLIGGNAGLMYRTSPASELGLSVPFYYRQINWQLDSGSDLKIDDQPFTIGVAGDYVTHLSKTSALHLTVTHQHMWNATMWGLFYQRTFR